MGVKQPVELHCQGPRGHNHTKNGRLAFTRTGCHALKRFTINSASPLPPPVTATTYLWDTGSPVCDAASGINRMRHTIVALCG